MTDEQQIIYTVITDVFDTITEKFSDAMRLDGLSALIEFSEVIALAHTIYSLADKYGLDSGAMPNVDLYLNKAVEKRDGFSVYQYSDRFTE